ncbi:helix-turn-helix domain-containing protein [Microlunatus sp. Y2014]|uniref:helix-turn-helix domain-containing protein n=1 Tax=Microlunatus sp. Y2014 TaxID=3418488 RepID=UPI003DA769CE
MTDPTGSLKIEDPDTWPQAMRINEVATVLRVTTRTVYAMVGDGRLPAKKVGSTWRITKRQLLEYLETGQAG